MNHGETITIESCCGIDFISGAYARWCHWRCLWPYTALGCNHQSILTHIKQIVLRSSRPCNPIFRWWLWRQRPQRWWWRRWRPYDDDNHDDDADDDDDNDDAEDDNDDDDDDNNDDECHYSLNRSLNMATASTRRPTTRTCLREHRL